MLVRMIKNTGATIATMPIIFKIFIVKSFGIDRMENAIIVPLHF